MKLHAPIIITPRLMAGVVVADGYVSIRFDGETGDGRARCFYAIDTPNCEHEARDLKSGVGDGTLQGMLDNLLIFMSAAGDRYEYARRFEGGHPDGDEDPFPHPIMEWCYLHKDEIDTVGCEIAEDAGTLIEED
jgi:hypothetical protein